MAKEEEKIPAARSPAPVIHPVFVFPTPDKRDLLFFVEVDSRIPKYAVGTWAYGDEFPGPPSGYDEYKLVHVTEQSPDNWERRWYAKDWEDQDAHNWTFTDGDQLIRTYLVRRTDYRQRRFGVTPSPASEFLYPAGATADTVFTDYGFVNDTVSEAPDPLKGLYIIVQRRFAIPVQTNVIHDDTIDQDVTVTRELVDKAARATGILTSTGVAPVDGTTVTVGGKTYTFKTVLTNVANYVLIGASAATALDNFKSAVNRTAGAGTAYAAATTVNLLVSATTNTNTTQVVEALAEGTAGNSIVTTDTSSTLSWGSGTLTGGTGDALAASVAGTQVERQYGDKFHDVVVTSTVNPTDLSGAPTTYPVTMTNYLTDVPYRFPQLMRGATMVAAWAIADSDSAARSYDEAWYIKWDLVDPMIGPYEARVLRFLTDDPDDLRSEYTIQKIVTKRETIGICRAWAYASSKGNSTYAEARQIEVPPSIHGDITIVNGDTLSAGQSTNFLPATPNFATVVGQGSMIVAYETKQVRWGLWIVEITEINCSGVYNGITIPFGSTYTPGVSIPDMGADTPFYEDTEITIPSGSFSDDNTIFSGITTPNAQVTVYSGSTVVGRGVSNASGIFSILMEVVYSDATTLIVRALVDGVSSVPGTVTTNDLSPARPSGTISADGTSVQGVTEAGATISILLNAVAQVETLAIPTSQLQIERMTVLGTVTGDGNAELVITWPGMTGTPKTITVPVVTGSPTPSDVATAAAAAAMADVDVAAFLTVTADGPDLVATALAAADHEATANMAIDNDTSTGLTAVTSSTTEQEGSSGVITADGTAIITVTSGYASWSPLNVPFFVQTGDDMTDVATKAAAALVLSVANDDYIPGSSTSNVSVTSRDILANDPALSIALTAGTCEGLPTSGASANTTAGGTAVQVTANAGGNYIYAFGTPLTPGDQIAVTASDAGGTSASLLLEASASPPSLATAVFADSDTITGTGSPNGATVRAYVLGVDVGDTTISGGAFTLNTDYKLVRGEVVEVAAVTTGNEDIRSASRFLTAADLNLEVPVFELTDIGYAGTTPTGATQIRIRNVDDLTETTATLYANGTFSFSLAGEPAGEAFDVYARYATGDSDPVRIFVPTVPKAVPFFRMILGYVANTVPAPVIPDFTVQVPWIYWMQVMWQTWMDGMGMTVSFPGTAVADIVLTNIEDQAMYKDAGGGLGVKWSDMVNQYGVEDDAARGVMTIPLDGIDPYDVVVVTLTYPDGDSVSATFNKSTFRSRSFVNGDWNYPYYENNSFFRQVSLGYYNIV